MSTRAKRLEVEREQRWREEAATMPFIELRAGWKIKVMPPFGDTVIRYKIELPSGLEKSVFFDSRCSIREYRDKAGKLVPYWEVWPVAGKLGRCEKDDINTLIRLIAHEDK